MISFFQKIICFFIFFSPQPAFCFLERMSVEEKVGQLLMVHFNGEEVNEEARFLIQELHVGSIIYYNWANGLHSPEQVLQLSLGLQKLAHNARLPIPLLIATDQENGPVTRLKQGFTLFPGNQEIGASGNPLLAEQVAFSTAEQLLSVGINLNLAPVVDISSSPHSVIASRSFAKTPERVIAFARKALQGYHRAGMLTTLKHFPGYGTAEVDPHQDLPVVKKTRGELMTHELLPFFALAKETDSIMTAHLMVPALDPCNCSTLSKETLHLLREIGFEGVIITDSLVMESLLKSHSSLDEAILQAFLAGCDLLLLGGKQLIGSHLDLELTVKDVQRIHKKLVEAVSLGKISEERLNESVRRILILKSQLFL